MSLNLFRGLMPAEEAFTPLFCQQAELILRAAQALRQMIFEHVAAPTSAWHDAHACLAVIVWTAFATSSHLSTTSSMSS